MCAQKCEQKSEDWWGRAGAGNPSVCLCLLLFAAASELEAAVYYRSHAILYEFFYNFIPLRPLADL